MEPVTNKCYSVRDVDRPFLGEPKELHEIPDSVFLLLANQNICCPGCHPQSFNQDPEFAGYVEPCHTNGIVNEFKRRFPDSVPPTQMSLHTKDPGELHRVLITENAIFCGLCPPRGAPTRCVGFKLQRTIFGNPTKLSGRVKSHEEKLACAKRALEKRPGDLRVVERVEKRQKTLERAQNANMKAVRFVVKDIQI